MAKRWAISSWEGAFNNFPTENLRYISMKGPRPIKLLRVDVSWTGAINGDEPFRLAGKPFAFFALDIKVTDNQLFDPDGAGGDSDFLPLFMNDESGVDATTEHIPSFDRYQAAIPASPTPYRSRWMWLPTVGDSHKVFDFEPMGGIYASANNAITVLWYEERPAMHDYRVVIYMEDEDSA